MDPIPIWFRRLWDAWDIRILVLLSFILQLILAIFGSRRKYMSSINILVWSAYIMADWVATVCLSKLSDAEGNQGNSSELWAIWAPLLLLHLGGPDTITAYSLEDNKLWLRHLMGLVVQMFVAIYVILMSWKNSWFSFMSLPAFMAGVAKYGERTWVLKCVSENKYEDSIPVGDIGDDYSSWAWSSSDHVNVLRMAYKHLKGFTRYLDDEHYEELIMKSADAEVASSFMVLWSAVEVKMGLMHDLLYTKATRMYRKQGLILRCISFGCTVTVLVGLIIQIAHFNLREEDDEINIGITWVLLVGALALEIYAAIVMFSSNWMMIWLINNKRATCISCMKWLSDRVPCCFNGGKNWSGRMGQFDLIEYWLKVKETNFQSRSRNSCCPGKNCGERIMLQLERITCRLESGSKHVEKWRKYRHKTTIRVPTLVKLSIMGSSNVHITQRQLDEIWTIIDDCSFRGGGFKIKIIFLHIATKICNHLETTTVDDDQDSFWTEVMEAAIAQSNYMMYLLAMKPSLLPFYRNTFAENFISDSTFIQGAQDVDEACRNLMREEESPWYKAVTMLMVTEFKLPRWHIILQTWDKMLRSAAAHEEGFRHKDDHFQQLTQGGELLTFLWFYDTPAMKIEDPTPNPLPSGP